MKDFIEKESDKIVAVRFVSEESHSKTGVCKKCQHYSGNIYFLSPDGSHNGPILPLHPNCCCHYQYLTESELKQGFGIATNSKNNKKSFQSNFILDIPYFESPSKGNTVHMRVKNSPGAFGNTFFSLGDIEFEGFDDMIQKLEKEFLLKKIKIDTLIISNHGGLEGAYPLGNGDALNMLNDTQISRLKKLFHSKTTIDVRMCHSAGGNDGEIAAQKLANRLNCKVIGYAGPVNYYGGRAFYTKRDPDRPMPYFQHFFQSPKPKIFYPQLEKNR